MTITTSPGSAARSFRGTVDSWRKTSFEVMAR
jgi:hypothetical protein